MILKTWKVQKRTYIKRGNLLISIKSAKFRRVTSDFEKTNICTNGKALIRTVGLGWPYLIEGHCFDATKCYCDFQFGGIVNFHSVGPKQQITMHDKTN